MERDRLRGHLDMLLLSVLSGEPRHGYALISALRERSGEAFELPEGTVYPALHRLEAQGLVASSWAMVEGRRRRVYRITGSGAVELAERRAGWRDFVSGVEAVIGWSQ